jgi:hypothetical protein
MASCGTFVSLLRSCYATTARMFRDDLTIETEITWEFTDPNAKWCGFSNVFNARTWYDGQEDWPELGEIEGAPRIWVDGSGACFSGRGPFGTEDQWDNGAYVEDALTDDPCPAPIGLGWGSHACDVSFAGGVSTEMTFYGDHWSGVYPLDMPNWLTYRKTGPPCCCCEGSGTLYVTDGPPNFTVIRELGATDVSIFCVQSVWIDVFVPFPNEITVDSD